MAYFQIALCFIPLIVVVFVSKLAIKVKLWHQLIAILLGIVAVFPISAIQYFIPSIPVLDAYPVLHSLLRSIFLYGLIEEIIKGACLIPLPHKNFTALQFLFISFVLGITIGCFESAVYYFNELQGVFNSNGEVKLLYGNIFLRLFSSDVIHMTCTGICGLCIFSWRENKHSVSFVILAVILHAIYDFFAGLPSGFKWFSIAVVLLAVIECRLKYSSIKNPD